MRELHRALEYLRNFRVLNYTAMVKILKKHDKRSQYGNATEVIMPCVVRGQFLTSALVLDMLGKVEEMFAVTFCDGDFTKGRAALRHIRRPAHGADYFLIGLMTGLTVCLVVIISFIGSLTTDMARSIYFQTAFPVYR